MATLIRKPNMNRIYVTGDVTGLSRLLSDFRAREAPSFGYWLPLHAESRLRDAIKQEPEYLAQIEKETAAWESAKAQIPADYRTRHGSAYGGTVHLGNEAISEPRLDTSKLPWTVLAKYDRRVRDLTGQSSINGRVMDSETLYGATLGDGRPIYRIFSSLGFGDDCRETYFYPADVWQTLMHAEVIGRKITPEAARTWLAQSRGCVGTELYEFAATLEPLSTSTAEVCIPNRVLLQQD